MRADEHPTTVTAATTQRRPDMNWRQVAGWTIFTLLAIAFFWWVLSMSPTHAGF